MTAHVLGAGDGYRYLTDQVAASDEGPRPGEDLGDYYLRTGNPPGRWYGSGTGALGVEGTVSEQQMANLYGLGLHPETGEALGRPYNVYRPAAERLEAALAAEPGATAQRRAELAEAVERVGQRQAVAGFDCTFSPVKSISALWAIADDDLRSVIEDAHRAAWQETVDWIESDVARTRVGVNGIAVAPVEGITVAAFDHRTSRTGDPQLHTHVVVSNKVRGEDGRWRSLDSRALLRATVAASERYNTSVEARVAEAVGGSFSVRPDQDPADSTAIRELDGIPPELLEEYSKRRAAQQGRYHELVEEYRAAHGHQPPPGVQYRLAQQATLDTRPAKEDGLPWESERAYWRDRAERVTGRSWGDLVDGATSVEQHVEQVEVDVDELAAKVVAGVEARRSTWIVRHLQAEAQRLIRGVALDDRAAVAEAVVEQAVAMSTSLEAPQVVEAPPELRVADDSPVFRPAVDHRYSSLRILAAEDRLLEANRSATAPRRLPSRLDELLAGDVGASLSPDQADAVAQLATSGRRLDLLIGPAGAGKTTTLRALIATWTDDGGSVLGLAPSAAAAKVLGDECEIPAENTAKWLVDFRAQRGIGVLSAGQLVLVDEAGMADTLTLETLVAEAERVGAKVVAVGDHRQLGAVAAGGALRLVHSQGNAAELNQLHRFESAWEAEATRRLREGDATVAATYADQGRIHDGDRETLKDEIFAAWSADQAAGWTSLMIASSNDDVAELSARARRSRVEAGDVDEHGVPLRTGARAGRGDLVVTRRNDRKLTVQHGRDWVKNGDLWTVTKVRSDGSLIVRHSEHGAKVTLPATYVSAHVELGYASTVHRSQGSTVDRAHALVVPTDTRESVYVAMTRGRSENHAYVVTDELLDPDLERPAPPAAAAGDAFAAAVSRTGTELSAHETIDEAFDQEQATPTLLARYHHAIDLIARDAAPAIEILTDADRELLADDPAWPAAEAAIGQLRRSGASDDQIRQLLYEAGPLDRAESPGGLAAWRLARHVLEQDALPVLPAGGPAGLRAYAAALRAELADRAQAAADELARERQDAASDQATGDPQDTQLDVDVAMFVLSTGADDEQPLAVEPETRTQRRTWRQLTRRSVDVDSRRRLSALTDRMRRRPTPAGPRGPQRPPQPRPGPTPPKNPRLR
jgi:conjugative relaxase-like TrwC/TraI family protein